VFEPTGDTQKEGQEAPRKRGIFPPKLQEIRGSWLRKKRGVYWGGTTETKTHERVSDLGKCNRKLDKSCKPTRKPRHRRKNIFSRRQPLRRGLGVRRSTSVKSGMWERGRTNLPGVWGKSRRLEERSGRKNETNERGRQKTVLHQTSQITGHCQTSNQSLRKERGNEKGRGKGGSRNESSWGTTLQVEGLIRDKRVPSIHSCRENKNGRGVNRGSTRGKFRQAERQTPSIDTPCL